LGPGYLDRALCGLKQKKDPNLLAGFETAEDAGVYKLTDDIAIVQSVDYFPPIVDDPFDFGQIAVANALSDIYAMGAKPLTALNIVSFPKKKLSVEVLREILKGGLRKLNEAQVTLVGGHSIEDEELKYGLAVTGIVHPDKILRNKGITVGEKIILTKPIGTGIINTALKAGMASSKAIRDVTESMKTLNRRASEVIQELGVGSVTDVTGFGLLGHLYEMVCNENAGATVFSEKVPIFDETEKFAKMGIVPAGTHANKKARQAFVTTDEKIEPHLLDILFDAQTSGGLLFTVEEQKADKAIRLLRQNGVLKATIIGEITSLPRGGILVK